MSRAERLTLAAIHPPARIAPSSHASVRVAVAHAERADKHVNQTVSTGVLTADFLRSRLAMPVANVALPILRHPIRRSLVNSVRQQFRNQGKQCIRAEASAADQRLNLVVR